MLIGQLLSAVDAGSGVNSIQLTLNDIAKFSIQVDFSGSNLVGSLKLQARNADSAEWVDISGTTQAITGAAGHLWDMEGGYRDVRVVWTYTSGAGTITAFYIIKENVVKGA